MKKEKILNIKFIIMAIICICMFAIAIVPKELQNDTFYTIKLGELILNNGIDMQEHFAWHEGLSYTYPHWLYDVAIYLIYNIAGFNGIYISSIILGALLGITIYLTNAKLTKNVVIPFFTTILIMYIGQEFMTARAQLVTFTLFVLTIYFIERFLENKKIGYAIGLIIIPIIIANVHAAVFPFYFVLYLPYIGEWIIAKLMRLDLITQLLVWSDKLELKNLYKKEDLTEEQIIKKEEIEQRLEKYKNKLQENENKEPYKIIVKENKNIKWLLIIMILAVFTGLLTPIGDTPYTYLIKTMKGTTTSNISEHLPIVLYESKYVLVYICLSIALITFTKVKIKLSDLFLFFGLMFLTIMSRRQASMMLFIGTLVINKMLNQLIAMYDKDGIVEILEYLTFIITRIIIYSVFVIFVVVRLDKTKDTKIVNESNYPVEAVQYIKDNLNINEIKLFNEYNFGSYILFNDIPVFIDSRADVYDPAFNGWEDDIFRDFINLSDGQNYEEKFEHYGITHLLIYKNSTLGKILKQDEKYTELYSDSNFIIYERD